MEKKWKAIRNEPPLAKVWCLVLFYEERDVLAVRKDLISYFGAIDYESQDRHTKLWTSEQQQSYSAGLIMSFASLVKREALVQLRLQSLRLERKYQKKGRPAFSLDPGYITEFTVVHTSLKEDFHKIYLYAGLFAESLLHFQQCSFRSFVHTPPCFARPPMITAFNDMRMIYMAKHGSQERS